MYNAVYIGTNIFLKSQTLAKRIIELPYEVWHLKIALIEKKVKDPCASQKHKSRVTNNIWCLTQSSLQYFTPNQGLYDTLIDT